MAEHRLGRRRSAGAALHDGHIRAVEAQAAAADDRLRGGEQAAGSLAEVAFAVQLAAVEQHLVDACHLGCRGEQPGIAGHAAQAGRRLVVDVAAQVLPAEEVVERRGHDFSLGEALQGQEEGALQAHRGVKLLVEVEVHGQAGDVLYHLLQQDEAQVAVHVALALQRTGGNGAQDAVLEALVQPQAVGHVQRVGLGLHGGHHAFLELEVRAVITVLAHLRAVPLVHPALGVGSVHRIGVDGLHVEADVGRQAGLVQQQFAEGDVAFVGAPQEGEVLRGLVFQLQPAFIVEFHHGKQRGGGLGQRGQVEQVGGSHRRAVHGRMHTEAFVVHRVPVLHHQHAATRIGTCLQPLPGNLVDALQHVGLHAVIVRHQGAAFRARHDVAARTCRKQPPDAHRQPPVCLRLAEQHLRHMRLQVRFGRVCQHHRAGLLQCRRQQRQRPVGREAGIDHRPGQVQPGKECHIVIAHIRNARQADNHPAVGRKGFAHLGTLVPARLPRQAVDIRHALLPHGRHESRILGRFAHAKDGNLRAVGSQGQYVEVIVQHGHRSLAQPGRQVLGFLRADAVAQPADLQLGLLAAQTQQIFIGQHLAAPFVDNRFRKLAGTHRRHQFVRRLLGRKLYQQHVVSRQHGGGIAAGSGGHTLHVERIGKHQSPETQLVFQQGGHHLRRQ